MANERLTLQIDTKTTGSAEVQQLSDALNRVVSISEKAGQSGAAFSSFPGAIKSFVQDPLGAAEKSLTSFASGFGPVGIGIAATIGTLSALAVASASATRELADLGTSTQNISLKLGLSTKEVGQFSFAARAVGQDIGVFETGMRKLSQGLADGGEEGKKAREALTSLGVSTRALNGDIRPTGEIFQQIAEGISKIQSPAERNTAVLKIFGRAGIELIPVLEHLNENLAKSRELGVGISDGELAKMLKYKEQIVAVDSAWEVAKRHFEEGIAGTIWVGIKGAGASLLESLSGHVEPGKTAIDGVHSSGGGASSTLTYLLGQMGNFKSADQLAGATALIGGDQSAFGKTLAGAQAALEDAKGKALEARVDYFGSKGQVTEDVAETKRKAWQSAESAAKSYEDQIKRLTEVEAAYAGIGKRVAEANGSLLGPASKLYGELDSLVAKGASRSRLAGAYDTLASAALEPEMNAMRGADAKGALRFSGAIGDVIGGGALFRAQRPDVSSADQGRHNEHDFIDSPENQKAMEDSNRRAKNWLSDAKAYNSERDELTRKSGTEQVSSIERNASFQSRMLSSNSSLTDSQKISEDYRIGSEAAEAIYQSELKTAATLSLEKDTSEAADKARLDRELALQKVKEDGAERIAALEAQKLEEFKGIIGGLFDAVASRQPNAIPNFVKSQVLGQGQKLAENAAKEYLWPTISTISKSVGASGPLTAGTWLGGGAAGKDPLAVPAGLIKTGAEEFAAAVKDFVTRAAGGSGNGSPGFSDGADGIPELPNMSSIPGGFGNAAAMMPSIASALSTPTGLAKLFGGAFGSGAASVMSGYGLSVALDPGFNTATRIGAGVGIAGMVGAGGYGIYSGLKQGGVGGDLKAAGSAVGLATGLASNIAPLLGAVLPSVIPIVGSVIAMALPLLGGLFNGPQQRANAIGQELSSAQYMAPTAINMTQSSNGTFTDFDAKGNIRNSNFSPYPQTTNPSLWQQTHGLFGGPPTWYDVPGGQTSQFGAPVAPVVQHIYQAGSIQTMDAGSFHDFAQKNNFAIGEAAGRSLQAVHGTLATEVDRRINR